MAQWLRVPVRMIGRLVCAEGRPQLSENSMCVGSNPTPSEHFLG